MKLCLFFEGAGRGRFAAPLRLNVKSVDGESLELVPYGCTKLRISMFPDDAGKTEK